MATKKPATTEATFKPMDKTALNKAMNNTETARMMKNLSIMNLDFGRCSPKIKSSELSKIQNTIINAREQANKNIRTSERLRDAAVMSMGSALAKACPDWKKNTDNLTYDPDYFERMFPEDHNVRLGWYEHGPTDDFKINRPATESATRLASAVVHEFSHRDIITSWESYFGNNPKVTKGEYLHTRFKSGMEFAAYLRQLKFEQSSGAPSPIKFHTLQRLYSARSDAMLTLYEPPDGAQDKTIVWAKIPKPITDSWEREANSLRISVCKEIENTPLSKHEDFSKLCGKNPPGALFTPHYGTDTAGAPLGKFDIRAYLNNYTQQWLKDRSTRQGV